MSQSSTLIRPKSALRLPLVCAVLTAGLGVGSLALYALCGASPLGAVCTWAAAFLAVYGPGSALREQLCPDVPDGLGPILDLIFGGAVFSLSALLASWTGLHFLVWVSTGLGWCVWAVQHRKGAHRPAPTAEPEFWLLAVIAAGYVFCNALWATRYLHPSVAAVAAPSQDFFWNLGNTQSLLQGFPMADLRVAGVTVSYHRAVYAHGPARLRRGGILRLCTGGRGHGAVPVWPGPQPVGRERLAALFAAGIPAAVAGMRQPVEGAGQRSGTLRQRAEPLFDF